jgi:DNA-binding NtrC family response regulator
MAVDTLANNGYSVIESVNGADALQKAEAYNGIIHAVVTNVDMPHINGHDLAREIKRRWPATKVLIVSSRPEADFPPEAYHHCDALLKPVSASTLLKTVNELVAQHRSRA